MRQRRTLAVVLGAAMAALCLTTAPTFGQDATESAAEIPPATLVIRVSSWQTVTEPEEVYAQQCAACHGTAGHGDGPAAVAFDPRPGDFADATFWAERTDMQIDSTITVGKGSMPPMGDGLAPEVRQALIEYLREKFTGKFLSKAEGS